MQRFPLERSFFNLGNVQNLQERNCFSLAIPTYSSILKEDLKSKRVKRRSRYIDYERNGCEKKYLHYK